jgi:hypothetical protein
MVNKKQVFAYKEDSLENLKPNSIIALKVAGENNFELYVTDLQGIPYSLKTAISGIDNISNTDSNLIITGLKDKTINIKPSLLNTINTALQSGSNVSQLLNDAGYITAQDLENSIQFPDIILEYGNILLNGLNITINANEFQWRINQAIFNNVEFINTIVPATNGFYRSDLLQVTNDNIIRIKQGNEDAISSTTPSIDEGYLALGSVNIFGNVVASTNTLDTSSFNVFGNGGPLDFTSVNSLATTLLIHNATSLTGFTIPSDKIQYGKDYYVRNSTGGPLTLRSITGTNNIRFYFAEGDLVVPFNSNVHLKYLSNGEFGGIGYLTLVGINPNLKVDKVLNKSLILDSEITRLAGVFNQDISEKANLNDSRIVASFAEKINSVSVTGDSNKTITLTRQDGTILTATFLDNNIEYPDDVINSLTFNANNNGVLIAITSEGQILSVSIDGRYSLIGHSHTIAQIVGLETVLNGKVDKTITINGQALNSNVVIPDASISDTGLVNNTVLQELGGVDKLINGIRIGRGNSNIRSNIAYGTEVLRDNTTGTFNFAFGSNALTKNTIGFENTAIGSFSLWTNTVGNLNLAIGSSALLSNTSGVRNLALGSGALYFNTTGNSNTAIGISALQTNIEGVLNIAIGNASGPAVTGNRNVIITSQPSTGGITTGNNNMILAPNEGGITGLTTGSGNVILGKVIGIGATDENTITIADGIGNVAFKKTQLGSVSLPSVTNALIDAETGKAAITKEYLNSRLSTLGSGTVTQVTATSPIISSGGISPVISIQNASNINAGALTATDWNTFNSKQNTLVSGTTIKTVNGESLLGNGNVVVSTGAGATNLSVGTITANTLNVNSSTGTGATIPQATTTEAGLLIASDKVKLNGITTGATANSTDAQLRDRATHTGVQAIATVIGLETVLSSKANLQGGNSFTGNQSINGNLELKSGFNQASRLVVFGDSGRLSIGGTNGRSITAINTSGGLANFDFFANSVFFNSNLLLGIGQELQSNGRVIINPSTNDKVIQLNGQGLFSGSVTATNFIGSGNNLTDVVKLTGNQNINGDLFLGNFASGVSKEFSLRTNKSIFSIITNGVDNASGTTLNYSWANGGQGSLIFTRASGEVARFNENGFVGINQPNPTERLDVVGNGKFSGNLTTSQDNTMIRVGNNGDIALIKKGGFVGKLAVSSGSPFVLTRSNNATINPSDTFSDIFTIDTNNNGLFTGTVTATSFFQSSDRRLKNIIKRDGDVIYYTWKDKRDDKTHIGYVAQRVRATNPDQVNKDDKGYLSVNYIEILVEKIRNLEKEIELLKAK